MTQETEDNARAELWSRENAFRTGSVVAHILLNIKGEIIDIDRSGASLLGREREYLLRKKASLIIAHEDRRIFETHLKNVFETRRTRTCEVRLALAGGSLFHAYLESSVIQDNAADVKICAITVRDINFLKQLESTFVLETNISENVINSSIEGIFAFDALRRFIEWNPAMEQMTGIQRKECVGKNAFEVLPFLKRIGEDRYFDAALQGRKVISRNRHFVIPETGRDGFFEAHYAPLKNADGSVTGGIAVVRDITERKKIEEELIRVKNLESIGEFSAGIAHEFNNLLAGILGNTSLARLYVEPASKASELLERAISISLRASNLTKQLTMLSLAGAPVTRPALIAPLLKESLNLALGSSPVISEITLDETLWLAEIDEAQIRQALLNIISFAKESLSDEGIISIMAENAVIGRNYNLPLLDGRYVFISIAGRNSHSPAVPAGDNEEPNYIKPSVKAELTIAYSIITNHEGFITAQSAADTGTTINIYLPAAEESVPPVPAITDTPLTGKGRLLVMEEDDDLRDIAGKILEHIGYETVFAYDGEEVLRTYMDAINAEKPFAAVILDLTIQGGMGGKETVKRLLDIDPEVKAVVTSGHQRNPVMREFAKYGFKGALSKPFRIGELNDVVAKVIKQEGE